jgi:rRNA pseudouridine-1189 N-methylase Emg1 (Nep1/Mra1 family)
LSCAPGVHETIPSIISSHRHVLHTAHTHQQWRVLLLQSYSAVKMHKLATYNGTDKVDE